MERYKVILICTNCTKTFQIEQNMLFELMDSLHKNGKEIIRTERNTYEVTGILFGEMSDQIIFT
ncbi:hypothetical protein AB1K09_20215 [Solibacillus silvestris]